jgi:hypothetical protein
MHGEAKRCGPRWRAVPRGTLDGAPRVTAPKTAAGRRDLTLPWSRWRRSPAHHAPAIWSGPVPTTLRLYARATDASTRALADRIDARFGRAALRVGAGPGRKGRRNGHVSEAVFADWCRERESNRHGKCWRGTRGPPPKLLRPAVRRPGGAPYPHAPAGVRAAGRARALRATRRSRSPSARRSRAPRSRRRRRTSATARRCR